MNNSNDKIINVRISKTSIKNNEKANVCLEVPEDIGFVNKASILIGMQNNQNEKQIEFKYLWSQNNYNYYTCNIELEYTGLYYFGIKIEIDEVAKWLAIDQENEIMFLDENIAMPWTITVYDSEFSVPEWAKGKIMYQIFPDRFYKRDSYTPEKMPNRVIKKWGEMPDWQIDSEATHNNIDFFMGNLNGIEEKIPYLKELGVNIIYLNPICKSQSNHRYDVCDYEKVDPYLGRNEDLKSLCTRAHKNGMKIIIDAVFNHTGNDSKYFNEFGTYDEIGAFQSQDSKYYNWYQHNENGDFNYWWGFKNLPVCNGYNTDWQNYICGVNGVIDKWFDLGIDGLRLDVADELSDDFIEKIRTAVKRNKKDGFVIGEVWENAITKEKDGKQRRYLLGKGLDSVMNYPFTNAILKFVRYGDYKFFEKTVSEIINQYPKDVVNCLMNSLSTHDITRAITTLVGDGINENSNLIWDSEYGREWQVEHNILDSEVYKIGIKLFKIATIIQFFLPGNSCIYYGDEIGMCGYRDPFNRMCFEWEKIGNEINEFFKQIGKTKNTCNMLSDADFRISFVDEKILCFERINNDKILKVFVNRTNETIGIKGEVNGKVIIQENYDQNQLGEYGYVVTICDKF